MSDKAFGIKRILDILPHRYPFLLVDQVVDYDLENRWIHARKNVTMNEAFFQGHFPEAPIMPGVLLVEAVAQTGGILTHLLDKACGKIAVLLKVDDVKFRNPVKPGDVVDLFCHLDHVTTRAGKARGEAKVGDKVAVSGTICFAFVKRDDI